MYCVVLFDTAIRDYICLACALPTSTQNSLMALRDVHIVLFEPAAVRCFSYLTQITCGLTHACRFNAAMYLLFAYHLV